MRPHPTFIEGVVFDNLAPAIAGIEISTPELKRIASADNNGACQLGYADPVSHRFQIVFIYLCNTGIILTFKERVLC